ncbi:hypothetical protein HHK36_009965 [Tetracentron sinense]|uniref:Uncharacterized protein n=1 Tax=Tetracentron sinense TaxID=13715 RepID=A0A834ZH12_TETSI|nr:hypothetical protein HHK36_009965 [Tetracentron sinense]
MENTRISTSTAKASALRWGILRQAFLARRSSESDHQSQIGINRISRKTAHGFNLTSCSLMTGYNEEDSGSMLKLNSLDGTRDARVCYTLPIDGSPKLVLM